jgi:hypothetical protein
MVDFKIIETQKYFKYIIENKTGKNRGREVEMLFTTKRGGVSEGIYSSLNMGYSTGDSKANIYNNRAIVLNDFNFGIDKMTSSDQVHGTQLRAVEDAGGDAGECDGLFTASREVVLSMFFADCTPLFFYDPINPAVGLSHAGWRGTCGDIASKSVRFMKECYDSDLSSLMAVIGPSIGPCCFETGEEVASEFKEKLKNISVNEYIKTAPGKDKFLIDLKSVNRELLKAAGLEDKNIFVHDICTACEKDLFYSYRRDCGDTGRMAALAFIV